MSALVFLVMKPRKRYSMYVSENTFKRKFDLLLIEGEGKRHYAFIKDSDAFMSYHILHHERKHFFLVYMLLVQWIY